MSSLSTKLKKEMERRNLETFREAEYAIGISHSTIQQVVNNERTGLTNEVRNKLISFSKDITISDFTEPMKKGAKKKSNKPPDKNIQKLLEKYNKKLPTLADQLRAQYLG